MRRDDPNASRLNEVMSKEILRCEPGWKELSLGWFEYGGEPGIAFGFNEHGQNALRWWPRGNPFSHGELSGELLPTLGKLRSMISAWIAKPKPDWDDEG